MNEALDQTNVKALPVKPRVPPEEGRALRPVDPVGKCNHWNACFEIDVDAGKCKCTKCGEEVSPIFVLQELMREESRWHRARSAYQDEMKRLAERSSTKCRHCGKLTRISAR